MSRDEGVDCNFSRPVGDVYVDGRKLERDSGPINLRASRRSGEGALIRISGPAGGAEKDG